MFLKGIRLPDNFKPVEAHSLVAIMPIVAIIRDAFSNEELPCSDLNVVTHASKSAVQLGKTKPT